jgi:hypothetical protein
MSAEPRRDDQMARSVVSAGRARGLGLSELGRLERAYRLAMQPRVTRLADDHHPAYLHPGRSALILMRDARSVGPAGLVLACVLESQDAALRIPPQSLEEALGASTLESVSAIPLPGDERLIERLVALDEGPALAVLAERLDQVRHLHLREDLHPSGADYHEEVEGAWLPFADRLEPRLATRFDHWARAFAKRIERG